MIRNDQNVIGTGGQSARGTVSSPASGASSACFRISERQFRDLDRVASTLPVAWSGRPNRISGAPSWWLW